MVERLRVTEEESMRVAESDLREVVMAIFLKCDVPQEDAERATDVLLTADLRGVESHGVSNSLRGYVQGFKEDEINPAPNWKVLRESPSTANLDFRQGTRYRRRPEGDGDRHKEGEESRSWSSNHPQQSPSRHDLVPCDDGA